MDEQIKNLLMQQINSYTCVIYKTISARYFLALNQYPRLVRLGIAVYEMFPPLPIQKFGKLKYKELQKSWTLR